MGDELAGESLFQDGLAEGCAALQGGVDLPLVLLDGRELLVKQSHDLLLLGEGALRDDDRSNPFLADVAHRLLIACRTLFDFLATFSAAKKIQQEWFSFIVYSQSKRLVAEHNALCDMVDDHAGPDQLDGVGTAEYKVTGPD